MSAEVADGRSAERKAVLLDDPLVTNAVAIARAADDRDLTVPSVFRCGLLILGIKVLLRTRGFGWTMRWLRSRVDSVTAIAPGHLTMVSATQQAVALAGALYPGRALCLEQSLVLYYVLRRQGIGVTFRMGIQAHPFAAHAWVEYNNAPLNDVAEHVTLFAPLPDVPP
jgi:hypothetical protein